MVYQKPSILIVDDEEVVCNLLYRDLSERGYLCATAFDSDGAFTKLAAQDFDVVLLDIRLPGMSGMEVLSKLRSGYPGTAIIMITAVNDIDTAVEAMRLGASDYLVKPFDLDKLNISIRTVADTRQAMGASSSEMDAIACGVEAKHELLTGSSYIVTQKTIDIARQLGIPDEEIQDWVDARARLDFERNRAIASSVNKAEQGSPV